MKSILRSIKPYWLYMILTKHKTIEVAKNFPKSEKWNGIVEMYCSKDIRSFNRIPEKDRVWMSKYVGKVACRFVCDEIEHFTKAFFDEQDERDTEEIAYFLEESCLSYSELCNYVKLDDFYGWHISDLKLSEFYKTCPDKYHYCEICKHGSIILPPDEEEYAMYHGGNYENYETICHNRVTRPPQSWMFVEELQDV